MSKMEVAALTILGAGVLGYAVSLSLLVRFRAWMGRRGEGWPRLLLTAMLLREVLLAGLYLLSLFNALGFTPRPIRLVAGFAAGIALAVAPWALTAALWRWWHR